MISATNISRRHFLLATGATFLSSASAHAMPLTPDGAEGPFYPYGGLKPTDHDWDLVNYSNHAPATGDIIYIKGRVLTAAGTPFKNAVVDIWQANAEGNYNHPDDYRADDFQGFGSVKTGIDGRYRFRTIKPGAYGIALFRRTPHIHFKVRAEGRPEFVTQLYFSGEPLNQQDGQFQRVGDAAAQARVQTQLEPAENIERNARIGSFDLILGT